MVAPRSPGSPSVLAAKPSGVTLKLQERRLLDFYERKGLGRVWIPRLPGRLAGGRSADGGSRRFGSRPRSGPGAARPVGALGRRPALGRTSRRSADREGARPQREHGPLPPSPGLRRLRTSATQNLGQPPAVPSWLARIGGLATRGRAGERRGSARSAGRDQQEHGARPAPARPGRWPAAPRPASPPRAGRLPSGRSDIEYTATPGSASIPARSKASAPSVSSSSASSTITSSVITCSSPNSVPRPRSACAASGLGRPGDLRDLHLGGVVGDDDRDGGVLGANAGDRALPRGHVAWAPHRDDHGHCGSRRVQPGTF